MKSFEVIQQYINSFYELGETINAADFLLDEYQLRHPNFKGFELREIAKPEFILMTTEGTFGEPQIIRIPENTFDFPLILMLNLLAHEMIHVRQKAKGSIVEDKNEREWQAYYEMLFHTQFPQIPDVSDFHKKAFGTKALEYYQRMGNDSVLQIKYHDQKLQVDNLLVSLL
ncbi:hypothetical protein [Flavobacterium sp. '19STA2R22 D10 B1']|uniref:hypothetical protein n=1 Tax=Flavobacterium aerium TaxID=3037261 RepID=UPI00278BB9FD|nr:hypothetical protein [Flavobacterium sp. '19STA2R22 D10 B1']